MKELSVIEELQQEYDAVNDADVRRAERNLGPPGENEKPLGMIHSEAIRKLWATGLKIQKRSLTALIEAMFGADDDEGTREITREAARLECLASLARDICWASAKVDIGGEAWTSPNIGMRAGWMLVAAQSKPPRALAGLLDITDMIRRLRDGAEGELGEA